MWSLQLRQLNLSLSRLPPQPKTPAKPFSHTPPYSSCLLALHLRRPIYASTGNADATEAAPPLATSLPQGLLRELMPATTWWSSWTGSRGGPGWVGCPLARGTMRVYGHSERLWSSAANGGLGLLPLSPSQPTIGFDPKSVSHFIHYFFTLILIRALCFWCNTFGFCIWLYIIKFLWLSFLCLSMVKAEVDFLMGLLEKGFKDDLEVFLK